MYDEGGFTPKTAQQLNMFLNPHHDTSVADHYIRCVNAVFNSFNSPRAKLYRQLNGLDSVKGTACIIQKMVYGNQNDKSCTGVVFSRNPTTGEDALTGEYLVKAQGKDIPRWMWPCLLESEHKSPDIIDNWKVYLPSQPRPIDITGSRIKLSSFSEYIPHEFDVS